MNSITLQGEPKFINIQVRHGRLGHAVRKTTGTQKLTIKAPYIIWSHIPYKSGNRKWAIVAPFIIRSRRICKTSNINFAIVAPSIIRWHTLQNSYSQIGDSGPLHHKVTQHLQNNQANIGDSGNLHHSTKTIFTN